MRKSVQALDTGVKKKNKNLQSDAEGLWKEEVGCKEKMSPEEKNIILRSICICTLIF